MTSASQFWSARRGRTASLAPVSGRNAPVANGYYPVYVDTPRGHAGFCAWHSAGSCNGTPVQFAFFFNLDGDAGCDPGGSYGSYENGHTNSQGLGALANVSGHELSEAVFDETFAVNVGRDAVAS